MTGQPPLTGIRVLEFAGLAPGPFAGKLLADYGASVLRIDRHDAPVDQKTSDPLAEHKRSIRVNLKSEDGVALVRKLAQNADVIIDPFRPGVLERLGLGPEVLLELNPRLVYSRMAGFRRDGKYKDMAGHDINYIAVSGTLDLFGRAGQKPYAPANIVGDFAGGGAVCFLGIVLALFSRHTTGKGQVVEANMVDGSAYMSLWPRLLMDQRSPMWALPRGHNILDGGSPFYDTYETKDGKYMAVGALEPQFYAKLIELLCPGEEVPDRGNPANWPALRKLFTERFLQKTRAEWEAIFDGTDACVTPVKTHKELRKEGFEQRPAVTLKGTPAKPPANDWKTAQLAPGEGGAQALEEWWGWKKGEVWTVSEKGYALAGPQSKL